MLRSFIILIFTSFLVAAILTPLFMSGLHVYFPEITWPFSRVFGRIAQITAAYMIYKLRAEFNLIELKEYILAGKPATRFWHTIFGLIITLGSISIVIPMLVKNSILIYSPVALEAIDSKLIKILAAAIFISLIEESFFRVLVFTSLKRKFNVFAAAVLASLFYATLHFIAPIKAFQYSSFNLLAGFSYVQQVFSNLLSPEIYPAFLGLFIVGMILCFVIERTGSFYLCLGMHMGWAAGLKIVKVITMQVGGVEIPNDLAGRYFLVAQPFAWLSMLIVFILFLLLTTTGYLKKT